MRSIILLCCCCLSIFAYGQEDAIPTLPQASLEEAGFNRDSIENLLDALQETPHRDFRGLVVIKDNHLVLEAYYNTFWRNTIHDIRSAGKSVTTLLLGIAIEEGLIENLDQNVYALFAKNTGVSINPDYKKITIRQLLDMSSGLDADTDDSESVGQAGNWIARDDWKEYLLNVPLISPPGASYVYADIHPLLVGLAIEEASGMSLRDYAQQKLFAPLGIQQVYWYTNAANQTGAAGNLYLTAVDFAKLGLLVANEGSWAGTQIIPQHFIQELLRHEKFKLSEYFSLADTYGMFWYKSTRSFGGQTLSYLFAAGNGGNQLIVVPEKKIVIALTSGAYGTRYGHRRSYAIMSKVLAALEK